MNITFKKVRDGFMAGIELQFFSSGKYSHTFF